MRPRDETKRQVILLAAAELFSSQPFHKVRLDDVAAAAKVGKGTLYIYFKSKENLFFEILYNSFARLVNGLRAQLDSDGSSPRSRLEMIVRNLVEFAFAQPQFWELMRSAAVAGPPANSDWQTKRQEQFDLLRTAIEAGVANGVYFDPNPGLTASYVPSMIRGAMLFGPRDLTPQTLTEHILRLLERGLLAPGGD
jgi:AcrR family transcriptional regulator